MAGVVEAAGAGGERVAKAAARLTAQSLKQTIALHRRSSSCPSHPGLPSPPALIAGRRWAPRLLHVPLRDRGAGSQEG